jgi:hypothetical protein
LVAADKDHRIVPFGAVDVAVSTGSQQAGVGDQDDSIETLSGSMIALEAESSGRGEHAGLVEVELDAASQ